MAVGSKMNDAERGALLPPGLRDTLPDDAECEALLLEGMMGVFSANGYQRVKTPLIEFEDSLLSGAGKAVGNQTFRMMDPISQRMMGVRADITPQISRIARSRLANAARPLRLSYAGEVLRVKGTQMQPSRQLTQVGAELIGSAASEADAEIIVMAIKAIERAGVRDISVDLTVPRLIPRLFSHFEVSGQKEHLIRAALDRKDFSALSSIGGELPGILKVLLQATGSASEGLSMLQSAALPQIARGEIDRLSEIFGLVSDRTPETQLTIDPVEYRGFEYHTGLGFTIFSQGLSFELASGGRYRVSGVNEEEGERATGVTLYLDAIIGAGKKPKDRARILVPADTSYDRLSGLHREGWVTVSALDERDALDKVASLLGCNYVLDADGPRPTEVNAKR